MITYSFTDIGSDSLYEHLYKSIKNDILQGVLLPDDKLPSKRNFAKNLGISTITVENAYAQLIAEGYLYSIPKKGYFVNKIETIKKEAEPISLAKDVKLTSNTTNYLADFTSNQTNSEHFPFTIWARLIRKLLADQRNDLMTNSPCGGILALRQAIANHLKEFRNMDISPEQVIIGAGTEYLYGLLIQLLGFDKKYAIEDPGYQKISQIYQSNQVSCGHITMDSAGVLLDDLESSDIDVIHISPSHHFPTGIIMPISRRYELLSWASKSTTRYIIEDDYDSEFRLTGQPIPTLQSIDVLEKVIYINTFSKTLSSTVRISYMVLPKHLVNEFYAKLSFYSCTVSNFEQYTLAGFIEEGFFEKHINRMRNLYLGKRNILIDAIEASPLSSYVKISGEDSGLHFLLEINTTLSDDDFCKEAAKSGINLSPLSKYYQNPSKKVEHIFVINYSSIHEEIISDAIERIYRIVR